MYEMIAALVALCVIAWAYEEFFTSRECLCGVQRCDCCPKKLKEPGENETLCVY